MKYMLVPILTLTAIAISSIWQGVSKDSRIAELRDTNSNQRELLLKQNEAIKNMMAAMDEQQAKLKSCWGIK